MPLPPAAARAGTSFSLIAAALVLLATCSGPTEPRVRPVLEPADTLVVDFAERRTVDVTPIAGTSQRLVIKLLAPQPGDSLSARLVLSGVTVDSVMVLADADTVGAMRQAVWIPRALSGAALELQFRWLRRAGATTVTTFLLAPDDEAEHAPTRLAIGDTVVEYLDSDTDLDRFVVSSPVGTRVTVWAQLDSASQPIQLRMRMYDGLTTPGDRSSALTDSAVVPLVFARDIVFYTSVTATLQAAPGTVGSPFPIEARYRVWAKQVDLAPETAAASIAAADTVREHIGEFGDVDRFSIPAALGEEFRLFLARDSLSASPLRASVRVNGEAPIPFTLGAGDSVLDLQRTPWVERVDASQVLVEVRGDTAATADLRPVGYRLLYQRRARAPETAPVALGLVDSVVTETLSSCADQDEFEITGPALTRISIGAVVHGAAGCRVRARLMFGETEVARFDSLRTGTDPDVDRWAPYPLQPTGPMRLRIEGVDAPGQPIGRLPDIGYTLDVYTSDSTPEIAPTDIALGDSLVTETIDRCSDRDAFQIVGPPGSVVVVGAGFGRATTCGMALSSENSGSGFFLSSANVDARRFGHITIPASGRAPLTVATDRRGTRADRGAPYVLSTEVINTAPELVGSALALGDTARESFSRCGDIDRFQVPLVQGEGVWLRFDRARSSECLVTVSLAFEANQSIHYEIWPTDSVGPMLHYYLPPVSATYELTVLTLPSGHSDDRGLPYSVVVTGAVNEVAPTALAVGDTSAAEPTHPNDLDLFVVPLQAGREYAASALGNVSFTAQGPAGPLEYSDENHPRGPQLLLAPTASGDHRFRVATGSLTPLGYRFMVHELDRTPESIPDTLVAGDTTGVEWFEFNGDQDDLAIGLAPGRYFRLEGFLTPGTLGTLGAWVGAGNAILAYSTNSGDWTTERAQVPPGGGVRVILQDYLTTTDTTARPGYRLRLVEILAAPESRPAVIAPGDSIVGESIGDPYDLDEYQFSVVSSGTYSVRMQTTAGSCGEDADRLWLFVEAPGGRVGAFLSGTDATPAGTVSLMAGTTYTIRVEAVSPAPGSCTRQPYKAKLTLQP